MCAAPTADTFNLVSEALKAGSPTPDSVLQQGQKICG